MIQLKIVLSSLNMSLSTALTAPSRPSMMASPILLSSLSHQEEPELLPGLPVSGVEILPPGFGVDVGAVPGSGVGVGVGDSDGEGVSVGAGLGLGDGVGATGCS